jgi:hypothetical protein
MPTPRARRNADDRRKWLMEFIFFGRPRPTKSAAFHALENLGEKLYDNFVLHKDYVKNIKAFRYTDDDGEKSLDSDIIDRLSSL